MGSCLSARAGGGRWLLRIDDLDSPRCRPEYADQCLQVLEAFGFEWDGPVVRQSRRGDRYEAALTRLQAQGLCYPCRCSRSRLANHAAEPGAEPVYPGTCRDDPQAASGPHALRLRIGEAESPVAFEDAFQGRVRQDCRLEAGDFVIRRRDGIHAYHLAVVVDDEEQGVTEVVRGADLLTSTPRQILLQQALGFRTPRYGHLPLLTEADGRKLAKSRRAVPLDAARAPGQLWQALDWLGQAPPTGLDRAGVRELWAWALAHWRPERLAGLRERRLAPPEAGRAL